MRGRTVQFLAMIVALALGHSARAQLVGPMEPLDPMIGTWEAEGTWAWGATLSARAEHTVGLNGRFMEIKTTVSDSGGPKYVRYVSTVSWDPETETHRVYSRQFDGTTTDNAWTNDPDDDSETWATAFAMGATEFADELTIIDEDTLGWVVRMRQAGQDEWNVALDTQWKRVTEMEAQPIEADRFDAQGPDVRMFTKTRTIDAPIDTVYDAWATGEGMKNAYAPQSDEMAARIDQSIGGRYEILFDGKVGSNGCQTLCYIPGRMICFTWSAPPQQTTRERRTWVAVQFSETDAGTEVSLSHAGFGEGDAWDATYDYFNTAWDHVLDTMKTNLEG